MSTTAVASLLALLACAHLTQANWEFNPEHPTWPANATGAGRHARATCTGCAVSCCRPGYCGSSHTGCKDCLPGYKAHGCGTGGSFCRKVEPAPTDPSVLVDNTNQASPAGGVCGTGPTGNWNSNGLSGCAAAATQGGSAAYQYCAGRRWGGTVGQTWPYPFFRSCCQWSSVSSSCVPKPVATAAPTTTTAAPCTAAQAGEQQGQALAALQSTADAIVASAKRLVEEIKAADLEAVQMEAELRALEAALATKGC